jgi:ATP-dependent RNA helicase DeaD
VSEATTAQSEASANKATEEEAPSFDALPLSDEVRRALSEMGYETPTPVQLAVWGPAADVCDVVVQAQTGTGKTAAFGLPLIDRLIRPKDQLTQALILCPTRELALQVSRELEQLAKHKKVTITSIYGGAAMGPQVKALAAGVHIVVGTPGRVLDHLTRGTMDARGVNTLVLDESDEMLSMGFERELSAIIDHLPEKRQTLLFSATLPPDIQRMAKTRLREPTFVTLSGDHVGALQIRHLMYRTRAHLDKASIMLQVIQAEDPESAIVFCNTKVQTEMLAQRLEREGYRAAWLNGDLAQSERERVMRMTREGEIRFLVATDVAARGIDISHLTHVVNFDFPQDAETYIHRTGRTGRAGRTGTAIAIVEPQDIGALYLLRLTYKIRPIERQLPNSREAQTRREADVIEALCTAFAHLGTEAEHLALAQRLMSHEHAEVILAGLLSQHFDAQPGFEDKAQQRRRGRTAPPAPPVRKEAPAPTAREEKAPAPPVRKEAPAPTAREEEAPAPTAPTPAKTRKRNDVASDAPATEAKQDHKSASDEPPTAKKRRRRRTRRSTIDDAPEAAAPPETATTERNATERNATERNAEERNATERNAEERNAEERNATERNATAPSPKGDSRGASSPDDTGDTVELHINAGRRHGAGARALKAILGEEAAAGISRIRVRERYSFIEVARDLVEPALAAFNDAALGDHQLIATLSDRDR